MRMTRQRHQVHNRAVINMIRAWEAMPDDEIDTTDAPEILDWSDARRGVFYQPVKQQITLRLDADIIASFKAEVRDGRRYQIDINLALREHRQRTTQSATSPIVEVNHQR